MPGILHPSHMHGGLCCHSPVMGVIPTCLEWERANRASSTSCAQHITLRDGSEQYLMGWAWGSSL